MNAYEHRLRIKVRKLGYTPGLRAVAHISPPFLFCIWSVFNCGWIQPDIENGNSARNVLYSHRASQIYRGFNWLWIHKYKM